MIYEMSKGWLLNKFKVSIQVHDEYIVESLVAAKLLDVSVSELKEAILKTKTLRGLTPPDAYRVGKQYYFLMKELKNMKVNLPTSVRHGEI